MAVITSYQNTSYVQAAKRFVRLSQNELCDFHFY